MPTQQTYDYIIAGTGCAGLSLAMHLKLSGVAFNKILLVDKDLKNKNDRTWCFWTKEHDNWFEPVLYREWNCFAFKSDSFKSELSLKPYRYCMLRGIDFYNYCLSVLQQDARFEFVTAEILEIKSEANKAVLKTQSETYNANYIFNSTFRQQQIKQNQVNYVQHFRGWVVETVAGVFNEKCPVFMDFTVPQQNDCRFMYVIPHAKNKALIEYTGFSKNALREEEYDEALADYLKLNFPQTPYTILETEQGEIPMAESEFINPYGTRVINIGTAGGASKPSSGYTFYFIQQQCEAIIQQIKNNAEIIIIPKRKKRFSFYDTVLLWVLDRKNIPAAEIFTRLFQKNEIANLLTFLNEETTPVEDVKILNSLPKKEFLMAAVKSRTE